MRSRPVHCAVIAALALGGCGGGRHASSPPPPSRAPAPRTDAAAVARRARVPVLCWHQIRPPTSADTPAARPYIVRPGIFAAQMRALDRAGYTPVDADALVAHVARGAPLPRKPVLLTFDDASAGQYRNALPVLRRHRFVATFFVMTVVLGNRGWMTRDQLRVLDRAGMTIAAHTWDHKPVPEYAGTDWPRQVLRPPIDLARILGHPVHLFAYPYGEWTPAAFDHLRQAGMTAAFQLAGRLDRRAPLWTLRRIIVPEVGGADLLRRMRSAF